MVVLALQRLRYERWVVHSDGPKRLARRKKMLGRFFNVEQARNKAILFGSNDQAELSQAERSMDDVKVLATYQWYVSENKPRTPRESALKYVNAMVDDLQESGRIEAETVAQIYEEVETEVVQEYLRGFGFFLVTRAATEGLFWLGGAYIGANIAMDGNFLLGLTGIFSTQIVRTGYTCLRMRKNWGKINYGWALAFGVVPLPGSLLAYPVQMMSEGPNTSRLFFDYSSIKAARGLCFLSHIKQLSKKQKIENVFLKLAAFAFSCTRGLIKIIEGGLGYIRNFGLGLFR